ncbi:lycopene cyclase family protein, partial [Actinophytocola sp.]|uniref:lycopene cyclase family protein n=1 Tax=Actinophytocola sp. TaxID=1872138 RepID=UPI00389AA706
RLHARLGPLAGPVARVRFPLDVTPPPLRASGAVPFGAAAGLVHPTTGFSLADTFRLAPAVASAVRGGHRAVRRVLWPVRARVVYRLRRRGLSTLLSLTAAEHEEFFDLFFALPDRLWRAYLSGRADLAGTTAAMAALFAHAPAHLRRKMINP